MATKFNDELQLGIIIMATKFLLIGAATKFLLIDAATNFLLVGTKFLRC